MTKIERLETEINLKTHELNESLGAQYVLRETLIKNTKTLGEIEKQLKGIEAYLKHSNNTIYLLQQENRGLKSSCDEWIKRAINLEFKVLSAGDAAKNRK